MKKIVFLLCLTLIIPYCIVTFFIRKEEVKFQYHSNMMVRVKREKENKIDTVPFEEYVLGVLAGEMPVSFELEALKAQAVAARSYVMKKMAANKDKEYDIVDTIANQVYLDTESLKKSWGDKYAERIKKIKTAVMETKGEYLSYDGQVAEAFFFSTSTGKTENSEDVFIQALPYLRSVDSMWDKDVSPVFEDQEEYTLNEFYQRLDLSYQDTIDFAAVKKTATGRNQTVKINGTSFKASAVVAALNLRSSYFTIEQKDNQVIIHTKGYGHGVGLSQYGAQGMAKKGYHYDQILKHYYQGIEIKKI